MQKEDSVTSSFLLTTSTYIYTSCALAVQIYLQMDRLDLARKEVAQAKSWAEDALLLQMMEAWVDLRVVTYFYRF